MCGIPRSDFHCRVATRSLPKKWAWLMYLLSLYTISVGANNLSGHWSLSRPSLLIVFISTSKGLIYSCFRAMYCALFSFPASHKIMLTLIYSQWLPLPTLHKFLAFFSQSSIYQGGSIVILPLPLNPWGGNGSILKTCGRSDLMACKTSTLHTFVTFLLWKKHPCLCNFDDFLFFAYR